MTRYGYVRVSTHKQTTEHQINDLIKEGIAPEHIISETISGATSWQFRPELRKLCRKMQTDDTLTVVKLDRLGRNALDVLGFIDNQKKKGISIRILNLGIDTSGAGGKLFLLLLAGFAEFERNIIRERIMSGLETARLKGTKLGRKPTLSEQDIALAKSYKLRGLSSREVGQIMNISKMTAWRAMNAQ
ncbi:recombinase family protein [Gluconobacter sp. Dm-62]|uniref:recombinase family protein n=1 Tax=Gluconobacter sp. Dm-62 TaxID=2799804 RepID=UPI001B8CCB2B|nr:recombinase family protein [Gluconobacter sp. Dm-62]MBS1104292.1 recombinase family protein [Gluconobacter sp. Dm-62]